MNDQDLQRENERYQEWQAEQEEHERQSYEHFLEQRIEALEFKLKRIEKCCLYSQKEIIGEETDPTVLFYFGRERVDG